MQHSRSTKHFLSIDHEPSTESVTVMWKKLQCVVHSECFIWIVNVLSISTHGCQVCTGMTYPQQQCWATVFYMLTTWHVVQYRSTSVTGVLILCVCFFFKGKYLAQYQFWHVTANPAENENLFLITTKISIKAINSSKCWRLQLRLLRKKFQHWMWQSWRSQLTFKEKKKKKTIRRNYRWVNT